LLTPLLGQATSSNGVFAVIAAEKSKNLIVFGHAAFLLQRGRYIPRHCPAGCKIFLCLTFQQFDKDFVNL